MMELGGGLVVFHSSFSRQWSIIRPIGFSFSTVRTNTTKQFANQIWPQTEDKRTKVEGTNWGSGGHTVRSGQAESPANRLRPSWLVLSQPAEWIQFGQMLVLEGRQRRGGGEGEGKGHHFWRLFSLSPNTKFEMHQFLSHSCEMGERKKDKQKWILRGKAEQGEEENPGTEGIWDMWGGGWWGDGRWEVAKPSWFIQKSWPKWKKELKRRRKGQMVKGKGPYWPNSEGRKAKLEQLFPKKWRERIKMGNNHFGAKRNSDKQIQWGRGISSEK